MDLVKLSHTPHDVGSTQTLGPPRQNKRASWLPECRLDSGAVMCFGYSSSGCVIHSACSGTYVEQCSLLLLVSELRNPKSSNSVGPTELLRTGVISNCRKPFCTDTWFTLESQPALHGSCFPKGKLQNTRPLLLVKIIRRRGIFSFSPKIRTQPPVTSR